MDTFRLKSTRYFSRGGGCDLDHIRSGSSLPATLAGIEARQQLEGRLMRELSGEAGLGADPIYPAKRRIRFVANERRPSVMMVTSAQHFDCYEMDVGKRDAPWRRSSRPADRGSCECLPAGTEAVFNGATLSSRMLPNHQYPIPQREPLIRIIRNRRIHRGMADRHACRRRDHPPNMLIGLVPHLDPKGQVAWDVVQVRVGQLAQKFIDAENAPSVSLCGVCARSIASLRSCGA